MWYLQVETSLATSLRPETEPKRQMIMSRTNCPEPMFTDMVRRGKTQTVLIQRKKEPHRVAHGNLGGYHTTIDPSVWPRGEH